MLGVQVSASFGVSCSEAFSFFLVCTDYSAHCTSTNCFLKKAKLLFRGVLKRERKKLNHLFL